jgi:hypothetical protein
MHMRNSHVIRNNLPPVVFQTPSSIFMEFSRIFFHGVSGNKNSVEFSFPESPGTKIQSNFPPRSLREQKFTRIPSDAFQNSLTSLFL